VNRLFQWLEPAPSIEPIQDSEEVKKQYKYWRIRVFYSTFIGYALYYFTRKSFTYAIPGMSLELGLDKSQIGLLGSVLAITYGISKFGSGIIGDRSNPRYMMALGLFLTGICNILFGLSSSLPILALFWGLNGCFQGFGWPPCVRFLTQWYSHSERGAWWSSWNVSHNVGSFLIAWIVGVVLQYYGWRYAMYVPGVICIFGGFFLLNRLRDTPVSLGLPPIEDFRNDYVDKIESQDVSTVKESSWTVLVKYIFKNPFMWLLAFAYFFVYLVRTGIGDWTALFLIESKDYSMIGANACVSLFEVGGFCGSLAAGWCSDKLFSARRGPINILFSMGIFLSIALFWMIPAGFPWLDSLLIFMIGFSIFGPQMMIGMAAAELSHKQNAATSTGFVGLFAYLGAAFGGYPIGIAAEKWGWTGFYWILLVASLIALTLLLPFWSLSANGQNQKKKVKYG
jgi:MFS transporter, OPA family, sugar phosphate sensor protein UhpC